MIPFEVIRHTPPDVSITLVTFGDAVALPDVVRERCEASLVLPVRDHRLALLRSIPSARSIGAQERACRSAVRALRELSRASDVTLIHGPHAAFLGHHVQGPLVLQVVDPWSLRVAMEAELTAGLHRLYRTVKARQALVAERRLPSRARLLTVGRRDAETWSRRLGRPVGSVPNGTEATSGRPRRRPGGPGTVCFVGSLNYEPNIESARTLVQQLAPLIWRKAPDTRFVLAGRRPGPSVLSLAGDRVDVLPNVPSVDEVFASADLALFPDRHGLGMRNSVSEALAAGLPVVATPAAAREQPAHPLLRVAESADGLVDLTLRLLDGLDPTRHPGNSSPPLRTWETVTREYLGECAAAAAADDRCRAG